MESTIVDLSGEAPVLLRPGGVGPEDLARVLGRPALPAGASTARAPGLLRSHYAPRAGVLLVEPAAVLTRALALAKGGAKVAVAVAQDLDVPSPLTALRIPGDIEGLARELYALLRSLDEGGIDVAVVSVPREEGLGLAVVDRLRRAAAPRPGR